MDFIIEKSIKIALLVIITLMLLSYWLIPKTKLSKVFKMNEKVFVITQIIGMICGLFGIIITLIWAEYIVELHIWELLVMPFAFIQLYWLISARKIKVNNCMTKNKTMI